MSKKQTTVKPIRTDDSPTEFFPKRGSGKRGVPTVPMIAGNSAKQKASKVATKAASSKPAKVVTKRRLSGLEAAAQVLGESRKAMTCADLVAAMLKRGLWKTDGARLRKGSVKRAVGKQARCWRGGR